MYQMIGEVVSLILNLQFEEKYKKIHRNKFTSFLVVHGIIWSFLSKQ